MSYKNQIELPKKNNENKKKSGLKWKYHEKFKQRYETYLIQNMNKNNLRLKGNYHYENKPVNYYLDQKESEPIKNTNLTPLPQSKYLNQKTKEKNQEENKIKLEKKHKCCHENSIYIINQKIYIY